MKKIFSISIFLFIFNIITIAQGFTGGFDQTANTFRRYPFYEETTNASCGPCASSNPALNAYLALMNDSLVAVTYHAWWPSVSDPMYQHNIQQNRDRIQFMKGNVNATPWLNVDGIVVDVWPFSSTNLSGAYNTRMAIPTPLGLSVSHQRISSDSVEVKVKAYLLSNLPSGNWKLRVFAVENPIVYTAAPGTNGEKHFPHVFRKSIPNSAGEAFPTVAGNYEFIYRYKFESAWKDSNLYSIAVVQDDITKEVANSGSSKITVRFPVGIDKEGIDLPQTITLFDNYPNPFNPTTTISYALPEATEVNLMIYNALGEMIKVLDSGYKTAGYHKFDFNAAGFTSGVYLLVLNSPTGKSVKKINLLK